MPVNSAEDGDLREELGLTIERGDELLRISQSIMEQCADESGYVRTSNALLQIASRKDLNDVEKVTCTFLLTCRAEKEDKRSKMKNEMEDILSHNKKDMYPDISEIMDFGMEIPNGHIGGMIISPNKIEPQELIAGLMGAMISIIKSMPEEDARHICMMTSLSFARMASSDMGSRR